MTLLLIEHVENRAVAGRPPPAAGPRQSVQHGANSPQLGDFLLDPLLVSACELIELDGERLQVF